MLTMTACSLVALAARSSNSASVIDLVAWLGALATVAGVVLLAYRFTRLDGVVVGGLAAICSLAILSSFSLWMSNDVARYAHLMGHPEVAGATHIAWERTRLTDFLNPYFAWLLAYATFGAIGMLGGGLTTAVQRWRRK